ncbi:uncharacterized protein BDZ83DRAFT_252812 [Colletotrichum acutatum]|uniref:Secreted protein n=1 Tax=Glomerella acutata TaxID=27357 RepID=A0AAD8XG65_GLOAC|nr:uncharacterized protein BDZ83DRAFT_252812 [Colletotrichum acutatum]KAK1726734.1 hypothetical protein BDZ83DRAFT_252812 [Colletotrichum acutatum]
MLCPTHTQHWHRPLLVLLWSCSLRILAAYDSLSQVTNLAPPSVHRLLSVRLCKRKSGQQTNAQSGAVPCICHLTPPKPDIPRRLVSSSLIHRLCADVQTPQCSALQTSTKLEYAELSSYQLSSGPSLGR